MPMHSYLVRHLPWLCIRSHAILHYPMIYVIVLLGSFIGICVVLAVRVLMRNRSVRKFVRSVKQRADSAESRGAVWMKETVVERPKLPPRKSAVALQEMRSLLRSADKAEGQKKFDDAEKMYIKALTVVPGAVEVQARLARLYLQTGREQKAINIYVQIIKEHDDVSYYANLGLGYYALQQYEAACEAYAQALDRDPTNPERLAALGRAYIPAGRVQEAVPLLEKAALRLHRDIDLLHLLADCYTELQDTDNARLTYTKINKLEPYNEQVKKRLQELSAV